MWLRSALVEIMAWCRIGDKTLSKPMMIQFSDASVFSVLGYLYTRLITLIARFMGPTWGPPGADRSQVGPMLAQWTLLSRYVLNQMFSKYPYSIYVICIIYIYCVVHLLFVIYIHWFVYSGLFIYYCSMCILSLVQWFYYVCFIVFDHVHAFCRRLALILSDS